MTASTETYRPVDDGASAHDDPFPLGKSLIGRSTTIVARWLHHIAGFTLLAVMALTVIDVIGRRFFDQPLRGTVELTELAMVVVVYLAFAYAEVLGDHIRIDLLYAGAGRLTRAGLTFLGAALGAAVIGLLTWQLLDFAQRMSETGVTTAVRRIPQWPIAMVGVVGGFVFILVFVIVAVRGVTASRTDAGLDASQTEELAAGKGGVIALVAAAAALGIAATLLWSDASGSVVGALGIALMLALLPLRIPVAVAIMSAAILGSVAMIGSGPTLGRLGADAFREAGSYNLSVIPMYVLMGLLLAGAGLGHDLYRAFDVFLGRLRGGLAVATIGASALFGAVSGSAVASTTTMSVVAVPQMRKYGYNAGFSAACAAAGGTLGVLIPPSAILVLYGVLTEEPIGDVLLAGILPGLMTTAVLMTTAYLVVRRNPSLAPAVQHESSMSRWGALRLVWAVPVIFGISMGGLYLGVFTPTESGAAGAFLALIYGVAARRLSWAVFVGAVSRTIRISAMIFLLVIAGKMLGFFLSITRIPRDLGTWAQNLPVAPALVIVAIFAIYFLGGMVMDEIALLVIMTPIAYPIVIDLGYSGVWFGVLSIMMLLTGLLTPPVGMLVFVANGITKIPLGQIFRAITPFWIALIVSILLVIAFPQIATILVDLAG